MPKEEWGTKRVCPTTGKRFYDMNRNPIVSPYTGDVVEFSNSNKTRTMIADKADPDAKPEAETEEEEVVLEDDEESVDLDLGDDVLDDDDEEDNVSLDDIADVAATGDDDD